MDTDEFRDVFAAEARDYLQSLNEDLLILEREPDSRSILDEMFRAAHSLKGMAGTMGYEALAAFTHRMESVLDALRTGELRAEQAIIDALFQSVDTLEVLLENTLAGDEAADVSDISLRLESMLNNGTSVTPQDDGEAAQENPCVDAIDDETDSACAAVLALDDFDLETLQQGTREGYRGYQVDIQLRANTMLKSVRVFTIFQALEGVGTITKSVPSAQELEEERFDSSFSLVLLTQEAHGNVKALVESISEVDQVQVTAIPGGEVALEPSSAGSPPDAQANAPETALLEPDQNAVQGAKGNEKSVQSRGLFADRYVRVETDRLDKLINLVGELVISRTQVLEMGRGLEQSDSENTIAQLDRVTTDLQYAAMSLRMVPIKQVFDRFPRMVRDLAQAHGKEIRLEIEGANTELDRSLVNEIGDPLVHLLRNSVDHGIETSDERVKQGKPSYGTIDLTARHEGSHVLIEIRDDGQGINVDKIREKAAKRGLISGDTQAISQQEAIRLLFEPGFSTSENVTDISGRGVGMDAVKNAVEAMSGTVEMQSTPGQGSSITIKLPLTLAIIEVLLVQTLGETYAIPIQTVRENLRVSRDQLKRVQHNEVILLRNEVVPIFDLAETLGFERADVDGDMPVIVVESQGEKCGFIVDKLLGQQEIVIKSLSSILGDVPGVAGAAVLGNGRVALILDNSTLIKQGA